MSSPELSAPSPDFAKASHFGEHTYNNLKVGYKQVVIGTAYVVNDEIVPPVSTQFDPDTDEDAKIAHIRQEDEAFQEAMNRTLSDYAYALENVNKMPIEMRDEVEGMLITEMQMLSSSDSLKSHISKSIQTGQSAEFAAYGHYENRKMQMQAVLETLPEDQKADYQRQIDLVGNVQYNLLQGFHNERISSRLEQAPDDSIPVLQSIPVAKLHSLRNSNGIGARLHGILDTTGTELSHAWIVAKSSRITTMRIPEELRRKIRTGDRIIIDGSNNLLIHLPSPSTLREYEQEQAIEQAERDELKRRSKIKTPDGKGGFLKAVPTADKQLIKISANAGYSDEVLAVNDVNALTIGLYRTELAVLGRLRAPDEDLWYEIFETVLLNANKRPITFRTLDFSGDKIQTLFPDLTKNTKRQEYLLRSQMRAILRLLDEYPESKICIMFPMVRDSEQFEKMRTIFGEEATRRALVQLKFDEEAITQILEAWKLDEEASKPLIEALQLDESAIRNLQVAKEITNDALKTIKLGPMVETPGIARDIKDIQGKFYSIGSNDLIPALRGFDRYGDEASTEYDPTHPQVLRALREIIENVPNERELSICGDMATNCSHFALLVGLGLRHLSVGVGMVPHIKELARRISTEEAAELVEELILTPKRAQRESMLKKFNEASLGLKPNGTINMNFRYHNPLLAPDHEFARLEAA